MRPRRLAAVMRKEFLHVRRDPRSLLLALFIPFLLLGLFGWTLSLDVDDVAIAVWDQSGTAESRRLVAAFAGSPYFRVAPGGSYAELERALASGKARAALVVPPELGRNAARGRPTALQLVVDGSDPTVGALVQGYADAVVASHAADLARAAAAPLGASPQAAALELRPRIWYNPDLVTRNAIVPGLVATILAIIAALMTSLTIAREWETGTMETLIATPVTGPELIVGKLAPYFLIGLADAALALAVSRFVFEVPLRGSVWLWFAATSVFLGATLGFGILISTVARSQLLASQVAFLTTLLPSFLLSGLVFAIADMPRPIQALSGLFPARYFVDVLRGIHLKGLDLAGVAWQIAALGAFALVALALATRVFRKKLA